MSRQTAHRGRERLPDLRPSTAPSRQRHSGKRTASKFALKLQRTVADGRLTEQNHPQNAVSASGRLSRRPVGDAEFDAAIVFDQSQNARTKSPVVSNDVRSPHRLHHSDNQSWAEGTSSQGSGVVVPAAVADEQETAVFATSFDNIRVPDDALPLLRHFLNRVVIPSTVNIELFYCSLLKVLQAVYKQGRQSVSHSSRSKLNKDRTVEKVRAMDRVGMGATMQRIYEACSKQFPLLQHRVVSLLQGIEALAAEADALWTLKYRRLGLERLKRARPKFPFLNVPKVLFDMQHARLNVYLRTLDFVRQHRPNRRQKHRNTAEESAASGHFDLVMNPCSLQIRKIMAEARMAKCLTTIPDLFRANNERTQHGRRSRHVLSVDEFLTAHADHIDSFCEQQFEQWQNLTSFALAYFLHSNIQAFCDALHEYRTRYKKTGVAQINPRQKFSRFFSELWNKNKLYTPTPPEVPKFLRSLKLPPTFRIAIAPADDAAQLAHLDPRQQGFEAIPETVLAALRTLLNFNYDCMTQVVKSVVDTSVLENTKYLVREFAAALVNPDVMMYQVFHMLAYEHFFRRNETLPSAISNAVGGEFLMSPISSKLIGSHVGAVFGDNTNGQRAVVCQLEACINDFFECATEQLPTTAILENTSFRDDDADVVRVVPPSRRRPRESVAKVSVVQSCLSTLLHFLSDDADADESADATPQRASLNISATATIAAQAHDATVAVTEGRSAVALGKPQLPLFIDEDSGIGDTAVTEGPTTVASASKSNAVSKGGGRRIRRKLSSKNLLETLHRRREDANVRIFLPHEYVEHAVKHTFERMSVVAEQVLHVPRAFDYLRAKRHRARLREPLLQMNLTVREGEAVLSPDFNRMKQLLISAVHRAGRDFVANTKRYTLRDFYKYRFNQSDFDATSVPALFTVNPRTAGTHPSSNDDSEPLKTWPSKVISKLVDVAQFMVQNMVLNRAQRFMFVFRKNEQELSQRLQQLNLFFSPIPISSFEAEAVSPSTQSAPQKPQPAFTTPEDAEKISSVILKEIKSKVHCYDFILDQIQYDFGDHDDFGPPPTQSEVEEHSDRKWHHRSGRSFGNFELFQLFAINSIEFKRKVSTRVQHLKNGLCAAVANYAERICRHVSESYAKIAGFLSQNYRTPYHVFKVQAFLAHDIQRINDELQRGMRDKQFGAGALLFFVLNLGFAPKSSTVLAFRNALKWFVGIQRYVEDAAARIQTRRKTLDEQYANLKTKLMNRLLAQRNKVFGPSVTDIEGITEEAAVRGESLVAKLSKEYLDLKHEIYNYAKETRLLGLDVTQMQHFVPEVDKVLGRKMPPDSDPAAQRAAEQAIRQEAEQDPAFEVRDANFDSDFCGSMMDIESRLRSFDMYWALIRRLQTFYKNSYETSIGTIDVDKMVASATNLQKDALELTCNPHIDGKIFKTLQGSTASKVGVIPFLEIFLREHAGLLRLVAVREWKGHHWQTIQTEVELAMIGDDTTEKSTDAALDDDEKVVEASDSDFQPLVSRTSRARALLKKRSSSTMYHVVQAAFLRLRTAQRRVHMAAQKQTTADGQAGGKLSPQSTLPELISFMEAHPKSSFVFENVNRCAVSEFRCSTQLNELFTQRAVLGADIVLYALQDSTKSHRHVQLETELEVHYRIDSDALERYTSACDVQIERLISFSNSSDNARYFPVFRQLRTQIKKTISYLHSLVRLTATVVPVLRTAHVLFAEDDSSDEVPKIRNALQQTVDAVNSLMTSFSFATMKRKRTQKLLKGNLKLAGVSNSNSVRDLEDAVRQLSMGALGTRSVSDSDLRKPTFYSIFGITKGFDEVNPHFTSVATALDAHFKDAFHLVDKLQQLVSAALLRPMRLLCPRLWFVDDDLILSLVASVRREEDLNQSASTSEESFLSLLFSGTGVFKFQFRKPEVEQEPIMHHSKSSMSLIKEMQEEKAARETLPPGVQGICGVLTKACTANGHPDLQLLKFPRDLILLKPAQRLHGATSETVQPQEVGKSGQWASLLFLADWVNRIEEALFAATKNCFVEFTHQVLSHVEDPRAFNCCTFVDQYVLGITRLMSLPAQAVLLGSQAAWTFTVERELLHVAGGSVEAATTGINRISSQLHRSLQALLHYRHRLTTTHKMRENKKGGLIRLSFLDSFILQRGAQLQSTLNVKARLLEANKDRAKSVQIAWGYAWRVYLTVQDPATTSAHQRSCALSSLLRRKHIWVCCANVSYRHHYNLIHVEGALPFAIVGSRETYEMLKSVRRLQFDKNQAPSNDGQLPRAASQVQAPKLLVGSPSEELAFSTIAYWLGVRIEVFSSQRVVFHRNLTAFPTTELERFWRGAALLQARGLWTIVDIASVRSEPEARSFFRSLLAVYSNVFGSLDPYQHELEATRIAVERVGVVQQPQRRHGAYTNVNFIAIYPHTCGHCSNFFPNHLASVFGEAVEIVRARVPSPANPVEGKLLTLGAPFNLIETISNFVTVALHWLLCEATTNNVMELSDIRLWTRYVSSSKVQDVICATAETAKLSEFSMLKIIADCIDRTTQCFLRQSSNTSDSGSRALVDAKVSSQRRSCLFRGAVQGLDTVRQRYFPRRVGDTLWEFVMSQALHNYQARHDNSNHDIDIDESHENPALEDDVLAAAIENSAHQRGLLCSPRWSDAGLRLIKSVLGSETVAQTGSVVPKKASFATVIGPISCGKSSLVNASQLAMTLASAPASTADIVLHAGNKSPRREMKRRVLRVLFDAVPLNAIFDLSLAKAESTGSESVLQQSFLAKLLYEHSLTHASREVKLWVVFDGECPHKLDNILRHLHSTVLPTRDDPRHQPTFLFELVDTKYLSPSSVTSLNVTHLNLHAASPNAKEDPDNLFIEWWSESLPIATTLLPMSFDEQKIRSSLLVIFRVTLEPFFQLLREESVEYHCDLFPIHAASFRRILLNQFGSQATGILESSRVVEAPMRHLRTRSDVDGSLLKSPRAPAKITAKEVGVALCRVLEMALYITTEALPVTEHRLKLATAILAACSEEAPREPDVPVSGFAQCLAQFVQTVKAQESITPLSDFFFVRNQWQRWSHCGPELWNDCVQNLKEAHNRPILILPCKASFRFNQMKERYPQATDYMNTVTVFAGAMGSGKTDMGMSVLHSNRTKATTIYVPLTDSPTCWNLSRRIEGCNAHGSSAFANINNVLQCKSNTGHNCFVFVDDLHCSPIDRNAQAQETLDASGVEVMRALVEATSLPDATQSSWISADRSAVCSFHRGTKLFVSVDAATFERRRLAGSDSYREVHHSRHSIRRIVSRSCVIYTTSVNDAECASILTSCTLLSPTTLRGDSPVNAESIASDVGSHLAELQAFCQQNLPQPASKIAARVFSFQHVCKSILRLHAMLVSSNSEQQPNIPSSSIAEFWLSTFPICLSDQESLWASNKRFSLPKMGMHADALQYTSTSTDWLRCGLTAILSVVSRGATEALPFIDANVGELHSTHSEAALSSVVRSVLRGDSRSTIISTETWRQGVTAIDEAAASCRALDIQKIILRQNGDNPQWPTVLQTVKQKVIQASSIPTSISRFGNSGRNPRQQMVVLVVDAENFLATAELWQCLTEIVRSNFCRLFDDGDDSDASGIAVPEHIAGDDEKNVSLSLALPNGPLVLSQRQNLCIERKLEIFAAFQQVFRLVIVVPSDLRLSCETREICLLQSPLYQLSQLQLACPTICDSSTILRHQGFSCDLNVFRKFVEELVPQIRDIETVSNASDVSEGPLSLCPDSLAQLLLVIYNHVVETVRDRHHRSSVNIEVHHFLDLFKHILNSNFLSLRKHVESFRHMRRTVLIPLRHTKEDEVSVKIQKWEKVHARKLKSFERATMKAAIAMENCNRATVEMEAARKKLKKFQDEAKDLARSREAQEAKFSDAKAFALSKVDRFHIDSDALRIVSQTFQQSEEKASENPAPEAVVVAITFLLRVIDASSTGARVNLPEGTDNRAAVDLESQGESETPLEGGPSTVSSGSRTPRSLRLETQIDRQIVEIASMYATARAEECQRRIAAWSDEHKEQQSSVHVDPATVTLPWSKLQDICSAAGLMDVVSRSLSNYINLKKFRECHESLFELFPEFMDSLDWPTGANAEFRFVHDVATLATHLEEAPPVLVKVFDAITDLAKSFRISARITELQASEAKLSVALDEADTEVKIIEAQHRGISKTHQQTKTKLKFVTGDYRDAQRRLKFLQDLQRKLEPFDLHGQIFDEWHEFAEKDVAQEALPAIPSYCALRAALIISAPELDDDICAEIADHWLTCCEQLNLPTFVRRSGSTGTVLSFIGGANFVKTVDYMLCGEAQANFVHCMSRGDAIMQNIEQHGRCLIGMDHTINALLFQHIVFSDHQVLQVCGCDPDYNLKDLQFCGRRRQVEGLCGRKTESLEDSDTTMSKIHVVKIFVRREKYAGQRMGVGHDETMEVLNMDRIWVQSSGKPRAFLNLLHGAASRGVDFIVHAQYLPSTAVTYDKEPSSVHSSKNNVDTESEKLQFIVSRHYVELPSDAALTLRSLVRNSGSAQTALRTDDNSVPIHPRFRLILYHGAEISCTAFRSDAHFLTIPSNIESRQMFLRSALADGRKSTSPRRPTTGTSSPSGRKRSARRTESPAATSSKRAHLEPPLGSLVESVRNALQIARLEQGVFACREAVAQHCEEWNGGAKGDIFAINQQGLERFFELMMKFMQSEKDRSKAAIRTQKQQQVAGLTEVERLRAAGFMAHLSFFTLNSRNQSVCYARLPSYPRACVLPAALCEFGFKDLFTVPDGESASGASSAVVAKAKKTKKQAHSVLSFGDWLRFVNSVNTVYTETCHGSSLEPLCPESELTLARDIYDTVSICLAMCWSTNANVLDAEEFIFFCTGGKIMQKNRSTPCKRLRITATSTTASIEADLLKFDSSQLLTHLLNFSSFQKLRGAIEARRCHGLAEVLSIAGTLPRNYDADYSAVFGLLDKVLQEVGVYLEPTEDAQFLDGIVEPRGDCGWILSALKAWRCALLMLCILPQRCDAAITQWLLHQGNPSVKRRSRWSPEQLELLRFETWKQIRGQKVFFHAMPRRIGVLSSILDRSEIIGGSDLSVAGASNQPSTVTDVIVRWMAKYEAKGKSLRDESSKCTGLPLQRMVLWKLAQQVEALIAFGRTALIHYRARSQQPHNTDARTMTALPVRSGVAPQRLLVGEGLARLSSVALRLPPSNVSFWNLILSRLSAQFERNSKFLRSKVYGGLSSAMPAAGKTTSSECITLQSWWENVVHLFKHKRK